MQASKLGCSRKDACAIVDALIGKVAKGMALKEELNLEHRMGKYMDKENRQ